MSSRKHRVRKEVKEKTKQVQAQQAAAFAGKIRSFHEFIYAGMSPGRFVCSCPYQPKGVQKI